ncbi:MAG TPA: tetratricopeptide repeat protein [Actinomycetes bacterium]|nr:tetratricopeptide repeat protein [Actinomycetes bacterium]
MHQPHPVNASHELAVADDALARGDLAEALRHLGAALCREPLSAELRARLARLAATDPGGVLALLPQRSGEAMPAEQGAVRAAVLAARGDVGEALRLAFGVVLALPGVPFAALARQWVASPHAAARVDPAMIAAFASTWISHYGDDLDDRPSVRESFEPLVDVCDAVLTVNPDPRALTAASGLARRLGRVDRAIAWSRSALGREPNQWTALMLAYALEEGGQPALAEEAYRRAVGYAPDDELIRLDLAELLCRTGRLEEGLAELDRILAAEPEHPRALPVALGWRWQADGDPAHVAALIGYLERHPERRYGRRLADRLAAQLPWVCSIPEPTDPIVRGMRIAVDRGTELVNVASTQVESPSALLALALFTGNGLGAGVSVGEVLLPDPREPRRPVRHLVWRYEGARPVPAVPPPRQAAALAAGELAGGRWFPPWYRLDRAVALCAACRPDPVPDLLGLLVHPPPPRQPVAEVPPVWRWIRRVQALACMGLAQLGPGWDDTPRREVLLDLADGPEDWTVEAALAALAWIAGTTPAALPEIRHLFTQRVVELAEEDARGGHFVQSRRSALTLALGIDGLPPEVAEIARRLLQ